MLPRENRLKKKEDFKEVAKKGYRAKEEFLTLRASKKKTKEIRVGIVVGQKVSKRAQERNTVKRRLREAVRSNLPVLKLGYDIVFIAQKGIKGKNFSEIKERVEKLLQKAKLIKND